MIGDNVTLVAHSSSQTHPALAGSGDYLLAWQDGRNSHQDIYARAIQPALLQTTAIQYDYDPLGRLTNAIYSGDLSASYTYVYDAAGNMIAYTETVGTNITIVNRTFNVANQLFASADTELGTTSFYYDSNGNLVQILPPGVNPGDAGEQLYIFNQRNLLTGYQLGAGSSVYDTVAEFIYDGNSNRLQQIDSTGGVTITYTNDIAGLSQVLVSNNGITTTYNLFGLDLIHVDNGTETRFLLTDGLGSTRVEMAGGAVETTTTYEPYGKLLAQTGASGTVYSFAGEENDSLTGMVYLRARYYHPGLKLFASRDPFPGWARASASQHGYSYSHNNPVNFVDPTGHCIDRSTGEVRMNEHPYGTGGLCSTTAPTPGGPPPPATGTPPPTHPPLPIPTVTPTPCPPTPTKPPTPTLPSNIEWLPGAFENGTWWVTHYYVPMESDPYYAGEREIEARGLPSDKRYKEQFIHDVYQQGTGLTKDGYYITVDFARSQPGVGYLKLGHGKPDAAPWETVASIDPRLPRGRAEIMIEHYQHLGVFRVEDEGGGLGESQVDVFVGEMLKAEIDSLGATYSKVGLVR